jgi:CheY-like chemotaxis protein/HD-like signal output (HDOD) protein
MSTILVVDDMAIFRDPIALSLQAAGYQVLKAADGKEALASLRAQRPDLVLLDVAMPGLDGMSVLAEMRNDPALASIPVIMLTALSDKAQVLQAASHGVRDYLLKSQFSLQDLLQRVKKHLAKPVPSPAPAATPPPAPAAAPNAVATPNPLASDVARARRVAHQAVSREPSQPASKVAAQPAPASAAPVAAAPDVVIPRLLTRDESLARAERMMQGKSLSGVVAQVISLATSPRADNAQLAEVIARDAILAARVLQVANTAAYASGRGVVGTIPEAIRNVGCNTVRNIAAAVGVFDAMPESGGDGFNPIRSWQHSFAVAQLCERFCPSQNAPDGGTAYLVGLCHDLGEILFHTHFASEYRQVVELHARTGRPRATLERQLLGVTRGELVSTIFRGMDLPEKVRRPVEAFHDGANAGTLRDPLVRVLMLAEWYANGALLTGSPEAAFVSPLAKPVAKAIAGDPHPPVPDPVQLRSEVFALTAMLARLSRAAELELTKPLYGQSGARVWVARDPAFSPLDPLAAAVASLARAEVHDALPTSDEAAAIDGVVVIARNIGVAGFTDAEIHASRTIRGRTLPALWLVGTIDGHADFTDLRPLTYPVTLDALASFVSQLAPSAATARAA